MIAAMPMITPHTLEALDILLIEIPSTMLETPTAIRAMPRNTSKNNVVVIGLKRTYPDKAMAIPPVTNLRTLNHVGSF